MWYSEKDEFIRKLFAYYNSKDAEKAQEYKRELGTYDLWDYEKCYRLIINEYEYDKLPTLKTVKDFRKRCKKESAKLEETKSKTYQTVTLRKSIKDKNSRTVKAATYQFAFVDWGKTDLKELTNKGFEKVGT